MVDFVDVDDDDFVGGATGVGEVYKRFRPVGNSLSLSRQKMWFGTLLGIQDGVNRGSDGTFVLNNNGGQPDCRKTV